MATSQADDESGSGADGAGVASRHPVALALGGGLAAGFGSSFIPMSAIEGFVTAYGIAELLPAAAPPLGDTARLALSAGIGTLTAGALLALLPRVESDDMGFETAIQKVGEAGKDEAQGVAPASKGGKLAGWLRTLRFGKSEPAPGAITDFADLAPVRIRNGDQHPDAPVRAPIRASSDLNNPIMASDAPDAAPLELGEDMKVVPAVHEAAQAMASSLRFSPPSPAEFADAPVSASVDDAPAVASEEHGFDAAARHEAQQPSIAEAPAAAPIATVASPAGEILGEEAGPAPRTQPLPDLDHLSVAELLARLEAGLGRRRQNAASQRGASTFEAAGATIVQIAPSAELPSMTRAPEEHAEPQPFRLRLGDMQRFAPPSDQVDAEAEAGEQGAEAASDVSAFPAQPLTDEEEAYLPPSILPQAEPVLAAEEHAEDAAMPPLQEDDMDAALRDALATLRQLSDRQRNS